MNAAHHRGEYGFDGNLAATCVMTVVSRGPRLTRSSSSRSACATCSAVRSAGTSEGAPPFPRRRSSPGQAVKPLPGALERPAEADAAERWDKASPHTLNGTYGEYLVSKVSKVFPLLATSLR